MYDHFSDYRWPREKKPWRKTMWHWILVGAGALFVLAIIFKGIIGVYSWAINYQSQKEPQSIIFTVENGETVRSIGARLEEEGLIISDTIFYFYIRKIGAGEYIKAGKFVLDKSDNMGAIVNKLIGTATGEIVFTIPEGWTITDIQKALTEDNLDPGESFATCAKDPQPCGIASPLSSLEGYLFPDTYFLASTTFGAETFTQMLLNTFDTKVRTPLADQIAASTRSFTDVMIMASIIEKEVRTDADRAIVAGILWKRLDNGWLIGADATLLYNDADGVIDAADLEKDDRYNTRKNLGLPPTPICNPGLKAIEAALAPQESPYWFYLTDAEGIVHYATTNEQHNANKAQYLE